MRERSLHTHQLYQSLGRTKEERCDVHREMFQYQVDGKFKEQIELLRGQRQTQAKRGRKEGWRKNSDDG